MIIVLYYFSDNYPLSYELTYHVTLTPELPLTSYLQFCVLQVPIQTK